MNYITLEQIVFIHAAVLQETGGADGVREKNLLESAVGQPRQAIFGRDLYPTLFLKAAVCARSIITHHPFIDGNKRTGTVAMLTFLEDNGYRCTADDNELFSFAIWVATDKPEHEEIAKWLEEHSIEME